MPWRAADISFFDIVADETDDPVVTLRIGTPAGVIALMAEVEDRGSTLRLRGVHVQGAAPNAIGPANLRLMAQCVTERMGYDAIEIEGAARTTGASPGRRPGRIRIARHGRAAAGA